MFNKKDPDVFSNPSVSFLLNIGIFFLDDRNAVNQPFTIGIF